MDKHICEVQLLLLPFADTKVRVSEPCGCTACYTPCCTHFVPCCTPYYPLLHALLHVLLHALLHALLHTPSLC